VTVTRLRFQFDSLFIDHLASTDIFRQIENQLRSAICEGRLGIGERLPSTRSLAEELGVSRNTVVAAYNELTQEGFIVTTKGSGARVTNNYPRQKLSQEIPSRATENSTIELSYKTEKLLSIDLKNFLSESSPAKPFRAHAPAFKEFPDKIWSQLTARRLGQRDTFWKEVCPAQGYGPLRAVIADYLGASRGLSVDSDQIIITSGTQFSVLLIAKLLVNPGDIVCFEDPGYKPAARVFEMEGAKILDIPVDDKGLDVDQLCNRAERVKLVYVTPASHFPLGTTLPHDRREALLKWAERSGALILEDDYNGEYRYYGSPLATLYSMSKSEQVIYLGSFSKLLYPGLRLGFAVVPRKLVKPLATLRWFFDRHSPGLEQAVLADFINEGHFSRHLRRMRTLYALRQQALVEAAEDFLDGIMRVPPQEVGLHLVGWLNNGVSESDLLNAANSVGIELTPVSQFSTAALANSCVIIGYAPYTPKDIYQHIKALANAYHQRKFDPNNSVV